MGCVLQQWHNEELKVIGYVSRAFSKAELRYCTTCRESSATVFGLKYYRHFLLGFPFVLRTDHAALMHLMRTPHPVAQSARYLDALAEYQFMVKYRPDKSHNNGNALSRCPCNRDSISLMCGQCGPMLEPIQEKFEEEEISKSKDDQDDELGLASARSDKLSETARGASKLAGTLQVEASVFAWRRRSGSR